MSNKNANRMNTGWIVKIGRGLDIYKSRIEKGAGREVYNKYLCRETEVEIFHESNARK